MSVSEASTTSPVLEGLFEPGPDGSAVLTGSRCHVCSALSFPATTICPECQSTQVERTRLSTQGVVYSSTVVRSRPPGYDGPVPYSLAVVELPEGLRVFGPLIAEDYDTITTGSPVTTLIIHVDPDAATTTYGFGPVSA